MNFHDLKQARESRELPPIPAEPKTIDITPTWAAILPAYLAVIKDGNAQGRKLAREELLRMAQAADNWNGSVAIEKKPSIKTTSYTVVSEHALRDLVAQIIKLSCWFEVEPECDDRWTVTVKTEIAHLAFKGWA